jgi:hypothetical protein
MYRWRNNAAAPRALQNKGSPAEFKAWSRQLKLQLRERFRNAMKRQEHHFLRLKWKVPEVTAVVAALGQHNDPVFLVRRYFNLLYRNCFGHV